MSWELEEAIGYYKRQGAPADQTALIALLREVQQENGGSIPPAAVTVIARRLEVKEALLLALIRRLPSLPPPDRHLLEVCAGTNCGRQAILAALAEKLGRENPNLTVKFVPCMRMCGKGPNIKWDGQLYHQADEALLRQLTEKK